MKKAKLETVVNNSYKETVTIKDKEILFELAKKNKTEAQNYGGIACTLMLRQ